MTLEELLKDSPRLHRIGSEPVSYRLADRALLFIDQTVNEKSRTLETGAGISTVLFAIKEASHTCIVPDADLVSRIRSYCARMMVSARRIDFHIDKSERALPALPIGQLDLVLIDGGHAFPTPFIDWYYTADKLLVGGILMIDDTQLWTGHALKRFLIQEPEWELVEDISARTAIFVKQKEYNHAKWWGQQAYVVQNSKRLIRVSEVRQALEMLGRGEFGKLIEKVNARIRK
jgi:predicted O-methyltransferase YrrM